MPGHGGGRLVLAGIAAHLAAGRSGPLDDGLAALQRLRSENGEALARVGDRMRATEQEIEALRKAVSTGDRMRLQQASAAVAAEVQVRLAPARAQVLPRHAEGDSFATPVVLIATVLDQALKDLDRKAEETTRRLAEQLAVLERERQRGYWELARSRTAHNLSRCPLVQVGWGLCFCWF